MNKVMHRSNAFIKPALRGFAEAERFNSPAWKLICAGGVFVLSILLATNGPLLASDGVSIQLWRPHDFSFAIDAANKNPFDVDFSAEVTGPNGTSFVLPGFFDGDGTWKVRVAAPAEGEWSLKTKSDHPALDGKTAAFLGVKSSDSNNHGVLQVDREHPHHFTFRDGTRFFMQAYEYDWLWALDAGRQSVPTIDSSLDLLAEHGFNYVLLNTYAHDTKWRKGKTGSDDYGPPPMYAWAGSNESPDHSRMNVAYWQHYDKVIDALMRRGMQAHIFIKVYNKDVAWPKKDSPEEKMLFRWLLARYSAYPNIIWDFSKEAHNEKDLAYKQRWLKYIRQTDPYHHLLTVHDDDVANDSGAYDELTDFRADQHHQDQRGRNDRDTILFQRDRRAWPVANLESDYECGPKGVDDKTYGKAMTPEATTKTLWNVAMAGGYIGYYYTYTAWDVIRPFDKPPGYTYMKQFGDFWRGTEYWKLVPSDSLVNHGWCLAQPGMEYVVYQEQAKPFTLKIVGAKSTLNGEWFNIFTGQTTPAGEFQNGTTSLSPPEDWQDTSLVLHLKSGNVKLSGETKQWHDVTLTVDGPQASETDVDPNPYLDYAFSVTFTHESGLPTYTVPGYFAADGNAGQTSATAGNQWRAHLSPDKSGTWNYQIHFQRGMQVAIGGAGTSIDTLDGKKGTFHVSPSNKSGRDLRAQGRLQYVGEHYLKFAGSKEYFLKVGADSPETLLAYSDFDGTVAAKAKKGPLKSWTPHIQDWRPDDPTWQTEKGKGLVGAINYLADQGMNVFSFLVYNVNGDGDNVWPFVSRDQRMHYDCSKLDQWNIVFSHGTAKGMYLHFKLSEHENSGPMNGKPNPDALDGGDLGPERKLFVREMVARFSHHLALNWNLAEETTQTTEQLKQTAQSIHDLDPYDHLIVVHTTPSWPVHLKTYTPLLGDQSQLRGASVQTRDVMDTHRYILHWRTESAKAGTPWVVPNDEQDLGSLGTPPDPGYDGYKQTVGPTIHQTRKYALWATLMAGGAGVEYFFGMKHPQNDVLCEDWRSREQTWRYARIAREWFVDNGIPFWEMQNSNALVDNPQNDNSRYCFAKAKELYLVYLPEGGASSLDLSGVDGRFTVAWFNPREGGNTSKGSVTSVVGGKRVELGMPQDDSQEDWLAIVRRE